MDKVDEALEKAGDIIIDCVDYFWNGEPHFMDSATENDQRLVVLAAEVRRLRAERDELRAAAKVVLSEFPENRDGMDYSGPLPVGIKRLRLAVSRTEGVEVGDKQAHAVSDLVDVAHMVLTTATVYTPPELVKAATEALQKAGEI